jgi:anaerobic selenocysteine-containing dehydrogenase
MTDRIADIWGTPTPHAADAPWPVRVDEYVEPGAVPQRWVQSACVLCSNGCACDVAVADGRIVGVRGRATDRVNKGRLGPKGLFGWQANHSADRLTRPLVRDGDTLVETDWDTAMGRIVERSQQVLRDVGPLGFGFYNTGQLFCEDYYALGVVTRAGIGTPHVDGNTRLCTATAAQALKETFGCDGQPASYADIDLCDALFLWGHNVAETQTVLWARMRDRLDGARPPRLVVVDPRATVPALRADVHLPVRTGTNLALMNALVHELIAAGNVDEPWVDGHTHGFDTLAAKVASCTAEWAAEVCDVDAGAIREAARIFAAAERPLSTVLQGFYQSHQATASAVQVNNLHLLRGAIGRPGTGVLQMNGQPTAQNTRETGCNGDLAGMRNWANDEHVRELAALLNVEPEKIPHTGPPTHAMQIFRYAEEGSIRFLWVIGTNPAVSLPELRRIRAVLARPELFLVVQDAFLTETARLADVVLPAALWGEKTGTFTNADRTVHLSEKAVEPPGEARADLDIFRDYAERMAFTDKDGRPLLDAGTPEAAFEKWKLMSAGRPCDYTGLSYDALRGGSGIQWPCTPAAPAGTERLYTDGVFPTDPNYCEDFGHDLTTGAALTPEEYRAAVVPGKAWLKWAEYTPAHDPVDDDHPLQVTNGRTAYHFHTRTKTRRAPQLDGAAPDVWVELSAADAAARGIAEGDVVRVETRRGSLDGRARITAGRPGVVFVPFHYGYFDVAAGSGPDGSGRAANELTMTAWDPVSKQPYFKSAAAQVRLVRPGDGTPSAPTTTASAPVGRGVPATADPTAHALSTVEG